MHRFFIALVPPCDVGGWVETGGESWGDDLVGQDADFLGLFKRYTARLNVWNLRPQKMKR